MPTKPDFSKAPDPPISDQVVGPLPTSALAAEIIVAKDSILIHLIEDGLSTHGVVGYRGQEFEFVLGSEQYLATQDRNGNSWLEYTDRDQLLHWGRVMFRPGPWPGDVYEDAKALHAERLRARATPTLPPLSTLP